MFSTFGGIRKREPLITFKKRTPFSADEQIRKPFQQTENRFHHEFSIPPLEKTCFTSTLKKTPNNILKPPIPLDSIKNRQLSTNSQEFNVRSTKSCDGTKKPPGIKRSTADSIFDFPLSNNENSEINLMVASRRPAIDTTNKVKRTKPKSKSKSPAKPNLTAKTLLSNKKSLSTPIPKTHRASYSRPKATTQGSLSIFDFDPEPLSGKKVHKNTVNPKVPAFSHALYTPDIRKTRIPAFIQHQTSTKSRPGVSLQHVSTTTLPEKKRKRNLVAHLKTATGETEAKPKIQGFDFLSDEEEFLLEQQQQQSLSPIREIISSTTRERAISPELSYAERMELELDSIMRSEFGNGKEKKKSTGSGEANTARRPQYQPLNKLNVRVTF